MQNNEYDNDFNKFVDVLVRYFITNIHKCFWLQQEPKERLCHVCVCVRDIIQKNIENEFKQQSKESRGGVLRQASRQASMQATRQAGRQASKQASKKEGKQAIT